MAHWGSGGGDAHTLSPAAGLPHLGALHVLLFLLTNLGNRFSDLDITYEETEAHGHSCSALKGCEKQVSSRYDLLLYFE